MSDHGHPSRPGLARAWATRWLGVGLAAALSVVTLVLGVTGRLSLYISPESVWFACAASVLVLLGAIWSCTLPLGAEEDHGHDHGHAHEDESAEGPGVARGARLAGVATAGAAATVVVAAAVLLPPASLSVELAMSRTQEGSVLFAGADSVALGAAADTSAYGIGEWSSVFVTATRPEAYDGTEISLTGFLTPAEDDGAMNLTRLVITHCVIDAQPAGVPVELAGESGSYDVGEWVEVRGTIHAGTDGALRVVPASVERIDEPEDPYEY